MLDTLLVRSAARQIVKEMIHEEVLDFEPLISSGLIDSLSIVRLIARLEEKLKVRLPVRTLQPDDFESVDCIVDTVARVCQEQ